ncbi:MAG: hypothetical protein KC489_07540 [Gemmatimonadetes bacterium]|nr:hypothetical protein [Gemmatimonadota bacterium]
MPSRSTRWLVAGNVALLGTVVVLLLSGFAGRSHLRLDELDVERLNIIGADGRPVMVIARSGRLPGPRADGVDYDPAILESRSLMSGMIFFNDVGDEVGGLTYAGLERPDGGHGQVVHLSMDQWKQNQVVALQYNDNGRTRRAGLQVIDRPDDVPMSRTLDRLEAIRAASGARRDSLVAVHRAAQEEEGGVQRVFLGSRDGDALMEMRDAAGRLRARLVVDETDLPRLEFLDAEGEVVARYPDDARR